MNVDWYRMRLKSSATPEEVRQLIQEQAATFRALPGFWSTEPFRDEFAENQAKSLYLPRYVASKKALKDRLEIEELNETEDFPLAHIVYVITYNLLFPAEWGLAAYRSYLPEQLPAQFNKWRNYISDVKRGLYRPYLLELYLYSLSVGLYEHWKDLQLLVKRYLTATPAHARKSGMTNLCRQIKELPKPQFYPAPLWSAWQEVQNPFDYQTDNRYLNLQNQKEIFSDFSKDWNLNLPANLKETLEYYVDYSMLENFEAFLDKANDEWLQAFFGWLERCCAEGMGLYLDY